MEQIYYYKLRIHEQALDQLPIGHNSPNSNMLNSLEKFLKEHTEDYYLSYETEANRPHYQGYISTKYQPRKDKRDVLQTPTQLRKHFKNKVKTSPPYHPDETTDIPTADYSITPIKTENPDTLLGYFAYITKENVEPHHKNLAKDIKTIVTGKLTGSSGHDVIEPITYRQMREKHIKFIKDKKNKPTYQQEIIADLKQSFPNINIHKHEMSFETTDNLNYIHLDKPPTNENRDPFHYKLTGHILTKFFRDHKTFPTQIERTYIYPFLWDMGLQDYIIKKYIQNN